MATIVLSDGSVTDVDEVTARQMVFRGDARYVGEQPRRFGDLSGQLVGSVAQHPLASAMARSIPDTLTIDEARALVGRGEAVWIGKPRAGFHLPE